MVVDEKNLPMADELEFAANVMVEDWRTACELEMGEDTLDLTSTAVFAPSSPADSCFDAARGMRIIPYSTSAISISISSWTATGDDDDDSLHGADFGGRGFCFVPDGFKIRSQNKNIVKRKKQKKKRDLSESWEDEPSFSVQKR